MEKENKQMYSLGKPCKGEIHQICEVVDYRFEEIVNEDGTTQLANVPFDSSKLDLGTANMYRLEDMLAAGIRPSNISTAGNSRLSVETSINNIADSIKITQENE